MSTKLVAKCLIKDGPSRAERVAKKGFGFGVLGFFFMVEFGPWGFERSGSGNWEVEGLR